ncbi:hypothetical protein ND808_34935 [Streptomyces sp. DR7-3]|uniref:hypothetical protein n=1 Tax=Streptomyces malaysiensis TaxID=92644 RepID=UPI0020436A0B|nr:hypothetical protein [Streptomyces sp. DR7-3]MCM3810970.1 hypothetical protein [Streptomyces sp. DR7-3]
MVEIGEFDRPGAREERHFVTHLGRAEILVGGGDHHETGAGGQCRCLASVVANLEQRAGISPVGAGAVYVTDVVSPSIRDTGLASHIA